MEKVEIAKEQVTPIDLVAEGVRGLRIAFVNVFGVAHADGSWTLIDAGLPLSARLIRAWAEKSFGGAPRAIVLTHGHFDHVSGAGELAEFWNVPVYAHPLEFPYLTGEREYPKPNVSAGGGMMSLLSPLYPRGPVNLGGRLRLLPDVHSAAAELAEMPGWQAVHTPGHTPGHVSFFRPEDRTLLVGDAFCTTKPESFFEAALLQKPELHGPPAYFTWDWGLARESVERLARLEPVTLAPGHGKPLSGASVPEEVRRLAEEFPATAPENRKGEAA